MATMPYELLDGTHSAYCVAGRCDLCPRPGYEPCSCACHRGGPAKTVATPRPLFTLHRCRVCGFGYDTRLGLSIHVGKSGHFAGARIPE